MAVVVFDFWPVDLPTTPGFLFLGGDVATIIVDKTEGDLLGGDVATVIEEEDELLGGDVVTVIEDKDELLGGDEAPIVEEEEDELAFQACQLAHTLVSSVSGGIGTNFLAGFMSERS